MDITPTLNRPHARLQRLAMAGQLVAWVGFAITALWVVAALLVPEVRNTWFASLGTPLDSNLLIGALIASLPAAFFAFCLWQAGTLFGALRGTAPFSPRAIAALLRLGWGAVATAVAGILCRTALLYLVSLGAADGTRSLAISLSSTDVGALLFGILALAFALVVAEAQRLDDDARGIV